MAFAHSPRRRAVLAGMLGLLFLSTASRGEVLTLKTGEKIRGKILSRTPDKIVVETPAGTREVEAETVASVEERAPLLDRFHARTEQIVDTDPGGFFQLAGWCADKGLFALRETVLTWVIGLDPDHEGARQALGYFRARNGQWLKKSGQDVSEDLSDLFRTALTCYRKQEDERAEEILKKILDKTPDYLDAGFLLGDLAYLHGKMGHAKARFKELVSIDPKYPWGHFGLALVALDAKQYPAAENHVRKALAASNGVSPVSYRRDIQSEFHYVLGLTFRKRESKHRASAEKAFRESTKLNHRHFRAWTERGMLAADKGKYKEAFAAFQKALDVEKDYVPARFNWGVALYRTGKLREAILKLRPLTRPPGHLEAYKIVGRCFHRINDFQRARHYYAKYIEKGGKDTRVTQWFREVQ